MLFYCAINMNERDKNKFEEVYFTYRNLLFGVAKSIVGNTHDAEDVLQNTFLKIANNMDCIEEINSAKTKSFLIVITKNTAYDTIRRNKNIIHLESLKNEPIIDNKLEDIVDNVSYSDLCYCIKKLSSPYSEVLYFHFVYDYSIKKTAEILNRKPATVKMQLVRGKKILIEKLMEVYYGKN